MSISIFWHFPIKRDPLNPKMAFLFGFGPSKAPKSNLVYVEPKIPRSIRKHHVQTRSPHPVWRPYWYLFENVHRHPTDHALALLVQRVLQVVARTDDDTVSALAQNLSRLITIFYHNLRMSREMFLNNREQS